MLSFFPTPYPDEILYSVFARYHARSGNTKPDETLQELFNSRNTIVRADLPYNLAFLIKNLPLLSPHTAESLIQKHTLYPMYANTARLRKIVDWVEALRNPTNPRKCWVSFLNPTYAL
jgi:TniQ